MRNLATLLIALAAFSGCRDPAASAADVDTEIAGQYILMGPEGHPLPLDAPDEIQGGEIILTVDGIAVRRVFLAPPSQPRNEEVGVGSYDVDGEDLRLWLRDARDQDHVWSPAASYRAGTITLRYPHPADGPQIVETYVHTRNILYLR